MNVVRELVAFLAEVGSENAPEVIDSVGVPRARRVKELGEVGMPRRRSPSRPKSVPPNSEFHGVVMWELRLPADAVASMIVRDGHALVPHRRRRSATATTFC